MKSKIISAIQPPLALRVRCKECGKLRLVTFAKCLRCGKRFRRVRRQAYCSPRCGNAERSERRTQAVRNWRELSQREGK